MHTCVTRLHDAHLIARCGRPTGNRRLNCQKACRRPEWIVDRLGCSNASQKQQRGGEGSAVHGDLLLAEFLSWRLVCQYVSGTLEDVSP